MITLALDSSGHHLSAAILDGLNPIAFDTLQAARGAELLPSLISTISDAANVPLSQIQQIAVASGPGSYTGLRNGISTALGIGFGLRIPVHSVSSLIARGYDAVADANVLVPFLQAREGERYAVGIAKQGDQVTLVFDHCVLSVANFETEIQERCSGRRAVAVSFDESGLVTNPAVAVGRAVVIRALASFIHSAMPGETLEPLYVKPVQAKTLAERSILP